MCQMTEITLSISDAVSVIALIISTLSAYLAYQRYRKDRPHIDLKVISSCHCSEEKSGGSELLMNVQIMNRGYVDTTIIKKKFIVGKKEYDVNFVDYWLNDKYMSLPAHKAELWFLNVHISLPPEKMISGDLIIGDIYGDKKVRVSSNIHMIVKIFDISTEGYSEKFNGYRFKVNQMAYSSEGKVDGVILGIEKPEGTATLVHLSLGIPNVDDLWIQLIKASSTAGISTAKIAVTRVTVRDK